MYWSQYGSIPLHTGTTLSDLIRRPELDYDKLAEIDTDRPDLPAEVTEQVNILIKYDGYISRQIKQVEKFKKLEKKKLPEKFDYNEISGLRIEAQQKLSEFQPVEYRSGITYFGCHTSRYLCSSGLSGTVKIFKSRFIF